MKMSAMIRLAALASVMFVIGSPALACSRDPPDIVGIPSGTFIASRMLAEAAFVDLVIAEGREPVAGIAGELPYELVRVRTLKRFKGSSPDRFTLLAAPIGPSGKDGPTSLEFYVDEQGRIRPYQSRSEPSPENSWPSNSCHPGFISPEPDKLYVVYRDSAGRALAGATYYPGFAGAAYGVVGVEGEPVSNPWLLATYGAAREVRGDLPAEPPAGAQSSDRVRIVFRAPVTLAEAERTIRASGTMPFAVRIQFGDYVEETRLPSAFATPDLIKRAIDGGRLRLVSRSGPEQARKLLAEAKAAGDNGASLVFERGLQLLNAERRIERARTVGVGRIASLDLVAPKSSWPGLLKSPLVAKLMPGTALNRPGDVGFPALPTSLSRVDYVWETPSAMVIAQLEVLASRH